MPEEVWTACASSLSETAGLSFEFVILKTVLVCFFDVFNRHHSPAILEIRMLEAVAPVIIRILKNVIEVLFRVVDVV